MIDTPPIARVEKLGVWKRGWTRANAFGSAPQLAIEIVVRAVGRIVVWVDAEAEVSTEKSRNFCRMPEPNTRVPSGLSTSFELLIEEVRAGVGLRGRRDEQVDQHEQDRREHGGAPRSLGRVLRLLVDGDPESQPQ
jgi:hypothetical protein